MHHNPGKNVLFVASTVSAIARRIGRSEPETVARLESARRRLLEARGAAGRRRTWIAPATPAGTP
jgi:hypothetical protein